MDTHKPETRTTILLVEDEPTLRTGVSTFLSEAGFEVIAAGDPDEVWTTLEACPEVRVLFADLDTHNGDNGLELARKVHERWPSIGLVITSGHIRYLSPNTVPGDGCFIPRPLPAETLLHELRLAAQRTAKEPLSCRPATPLSP